MRANKVVMWSGIAAAMVIFSCGVKSTDNPVPTPTTTMIQTTRPITLPPTTHPTVPPTTHPTTDPQTSAADATRKGISKATTRPTTDLGAEPIHPGAYCSPVGSTGRTAAGTLMRCTLKPGDDHARWRAA